MSVVEQFPYCDRNPASHELELLLVLRYECFSAIATSVVNETAVRYFATAKAAIQAQTRGVPHA